MANGVEELLLQIYRMIDDARTPFGGTTCKIDREKALDILDEIKQKYPVELKQAQTVMAQRTELLNEAQAEAQRLLSNAQAEAEQVLRNAQAEADHRLESSELKRRLDAAIQQRTEKYRQEMAEQKRKDEEAARERVSHTERQCAELRKAVDSYCIDALRRAEEAMSGALNDIRRAHSGFAHLSSTGDPSQQAKSGPYDAAADTE